MSADPVATVPVEPKPSEEDFTPRAVERAVRNEAVQHPLTILPTATALGFGFWNLVVGLSVGSLAGMLGFAFIGGVSAAYQYLMRHEDHAKRYVDGKLALRRRYEAQEVQDLEGDCRRAGFTDGVQRIAALRAAYATFERRTRERNDADTVEHLGRDAFREGVAAVRRAFEIQAVRRDTDVARLVRERDEWTRRSKGRKETTGDSQEDRALGRRMAAIEQRIAGDRELGELVDELLARAVEIETALETAVLDLAARGGRELADADSGAGGQLAMALEAARRVQARAGGGVRREMDGDAEYLQAGRRERTDKEGTHGG